MMNKLIKLWDDVKEENSLSASKFYNNNLQLWFSLFLRPKKKYKIKQGKLCMEWMYLTFS